LEFWQLAKRIRYCLNLCQIMVKVGLIMPNVWCNLVETPPQCFQTQGHHGVHLEYVKLCQLKRKISVAQKSHLWHHMWHSKTYAQPGMYWSCRDGYRSEVRYQGRGARLYSTNNFRKAAYRQYTLWRCKKCTWHNLSKVLLSLHYQSILL
jgi:hypothetical protein